MIKKRTIQKKTVSNKVKAVKKTAKRVAAKRTTPEQKTNKGKAEKSKTIISSFKKKDLEVIRKKLIREKERILQDVIALKSDSVNKSLKDISGDLSGYSFHMADMATDLYDREFSLGLAEGERERLYELDEAIKRIDEGSYGICETCGEKIPSGRLKVVPHARYCIKHKEEMERSSER